MKSTKRLSAEDYASSNSLSQQKAFDNFLSLLNITEGMKGVDIGCGAGVNTAILAEKVGNEGVILGIDPDKERINVAQKKYEKKENLKFFTAKSNDIPTGGEDYDFIVSNYVMHWVPEHEKVETYKRVFEVLKPGGVFGSIESTKIADEYANIISFALKEKRDNIYDDFHFVSLEKNREIFSSIGFEILTLEEVVYENTLVSLDEYFKWLDATLHGFINSKEIYERNEKHIELVVDEDGSIKQRYWTHKIILRKPFN